MEGSNLIEMTQAEFKKLLNPSRSSKQKTVKDIHTLISSMPVLSEDEILQKQCDKHLHTTKFKKYRYQVTKYTNLNKDQVETVNLRKFRVYDIDHKISVLYGFLHNISPEVLSHPSNLRIVTHKTNSIKSHKNLIDDSNKWILSKSVEVIKETKLIFKNGKFIEI